MNLENKGLNLIISPDASRNIDILVLASFYLVHKSHVNALNQKPMLRISRNFAGDFI